jgi:putative transposase
VPSRLKRYQESRQTHFVTFSCYHRQPNLRDPQACDLFVVCLEDMRRRFEMRVYGYVVIPEHVHLLVSEPEKDVLADAIHFLKLAFAKRSRSLDSESAPQVSAQTTGANLGHRREQERPPVAIPFWQARYYDRNVRDADEFALKLRYLHRNPVVRGLVKEPADWKWSSFRHYAFREIRIVEIESEWTTSDRECRAHGGPGRVLLLPSG